MDTQTPILHHYEISPYSEKIRLAFGIKSMAWRSVLIPIIMPKPDLTALTGGYRKTPVLQIGADIYCDTKLIVRTLDRLQPDPPLLPAGTEVRQTAMTKFGDAMFMIVVAVFFGSDNAIFDEEFIKDREKIIPGGINLELMKSIMPAKLDQLRAHLTMLESEIGKGGPFLCGPSPTAADLAVRHAVLFLSASPTSASLLEACPAVRAWCEKIDAFGHGERSELDPADAIEIAREARSDTPASVGSDDPNGRKPGDMVIVMPEDFARDPVAGELVYADVYEIAIKRTDPRAGEVVVHFPREDMAVISA
jgi:glutathione S-transferase